MTYQQLISHFGTQEEAARALLINQSAVSQMHKSGKIPHGIQCYAQIVTGGRLQADPKVKKSRSRHSTLPAAKA